MSLVGLDGAAYNDSYSMSDAAPPSAASAAPIQMQNRFDFNMPQTTPQAAASSSSSTTAIPTHLTSPLQFAPSSAPRSRANGSVTLDFSEFTDEIEVMEEKKRAELRDKLESDARRIANEKNGLAALPSQIGDSKLFHEVVLKQYGKVHHLELDSKKAFQNRKVKKRDARRLKKAEDKQDQREARLGGTSKKKNDRNKSKGAY